MKVELLSPIIEALASGTLPIPVVDSVHRWGGQLETTARKRYLRLCAFY